jgi:NhaP-type Na+/H+ or K+/H+ antiporter
MSSQTLLIGLALVVILSVLARLFGGWAKIPVIVPLLAIGVIAGESVTGIVNPKELFGDSFSPLVQIIVALILFEGALKLKFDQFPHEVRPAVLRLVTFGVLVTWGLGSLGAILILDLPVSISLLIGAILIVSGPTVVLPLLDFVKPPSRIRATLKWEGVIMDPIGAIVAVVVFGALVTNDGLTAFSIEQFFLTAITGVASGLVFTALLVPILATHRFSGRDKVAATLMMVIASFLVADLVFQDAGLAAALVMGVALANQRKVNISYIDAFKETLIPILLGILFVLLAANIDIDAVIALGLPGLALIAFLSFVVRPLAVLTTLGLPISWKERAMMMSISARGVVAAATAPVFGLVLVDRGVKGADEIVPVVFLVIAGTVLVSSILSPLVGKRLGLSGKGAPSIFVIGTPEWAISLGKALTSVGTDVLFWTVGSDEARKVEQAGLTVLTKPIDPRDPESLSGLSDISLIAVASKDDSFNELFAFNLSETLEPDQVYRVPAAEGSPTIIKNASRLIEADLEIDEIESRVEAGQEFAIFDAEQKLPSGAVPLVVIETTKTLDKPEVFFHCDRPETPRRRTRRVAALVPADPH